MSLQKHSPNFCVLLSCHFFSFGLSDITLSRQHRGYVAKDAPTMTTAYPSPMWSSSRRRRAHACLAPRDRYCPSATLCARKRERETTSAHRHSHPHTRTYIYICICIHQTLYCFLGWLVLKIRHAGAWMRHHLPNNTCLLHLILYIFFYMYMFFPPNYYSFFFFFISLFFVSSTFHCDFSSAIYSIRRCYKAFSSTTLRHEDNVRYGVRSCSRFLTRAPLAALLYLYVLVAWFAAFVWSLYVCIFVSLRSLMLADGNESQRWLTIGKRKGSVLKCWFFGISVMER